MKSYSMKETGTYRFDPPFEVNIEVTSLDNLEGHVIARVEEDELRVISEGLDLEMAIRGMATQLNRLAAGKRFKYRAFPK